MLSLLGSNFIKTQRLRSHMFCIVLASDYGISDVRVCRLEWAAGYGVIRRKWLVYPPMDSRFGGVRVYHVFESAIGCGVGDSRCV